MDAKTRIALLSLGQAVLALHEMTVRSYPPTPDGQAEAKKHRELFEKAIVEFVQAIKNE